MSEAVRSVQDYYSISSVSDVLGAEVVGLDVSQPLDAATIAALANFTSLCSNNLRNNKQR